MIAVAFAYVGPGPRRTEAPNPCCRRLPQEPMRNLHVLGLLPGLQANLSHRSGGSPISLWRGGRAECVDEHRGRRRTRDANLSESYLLKPVDQTLRQLLYLSRQQGRCAIDLGFAGLFQNCRDCRDDRQGPLRLCENALIRDRRAQVIVVSDRGRKIPGSMKSRNVRQGME